MEWAADVRLSCRMNARRETAGDQGAWMIAWIKVLKAFELSFSHKKPIYTDTLKGHTLGIL